MNQDIYERVKGLAVEIMNASEIENTKQYWVVYQELEKVCLENERGEANHPFQWETLGDFTTDNKAALNIYKKAIEFAESLNLNEYVASVKLAMAERYIELGSYEEAFKVASQANEIAKELNDLELRKEIGEFLLNESNRSKNT